MIKENGFVNDANYVVGCGQTLCPYYAAWHRILIRSYDKGYHKRYPSYIGCSVSPDWKYFSHFKLWMEGQDWKGKCLDKDLIGGESKVYSPSTCIFISHKMNRALSLKPLKGAASRSVSLTEGGRYAVRVRTNNKLLRLGVYSLLEDAKKVVYDTKKAHLLKLLEEEGLGQYKENLLAFVEKAYG